MGFLVFMGKKKILFVKVCQLLSEKCMCYRKFKCRGKRVELHSAHLPPANISNSIQASKVNRIYFKWVKCFFFFFSHVLSLALKAVKEFARVLSV